MEIFELKIKDIETYIIKNPPPYYGGRNWIFLKLMTDEEIFGLGEVGTSPYIINPRTTTQLIQDIGKSLVTDSDPFNIENLWRRLYSRICAEHPDLMMMGVISAFEIACWDIIGKALNQPIYNLLGGKYHDKLRAYTYIYPTTLWAADDPEPLVEKALEYQKQGFTALKFDPVEFEPCGLSPSQLSLKTILHVENFVKSLREAIGDNCDIILGTHGEMTTSGAIRLAKRLEKYNLMWFEEPVPPENIDEMARVARVTSIPIATGERLSTKHEFAEVLEKQAASILQMALGRVGGILEAKKIAGMAEAHYAQIAPHLYCGPVEGAANIQLDTCSPNFLIQEGIEMWGGFHAKILKEPIQWQKGYIIPPTKPGLGIELNEEAIAEQSAYS